VGNKHPLIKKKLEKIFNKEKKKEEKKKKGEKKLFYLVNNPTCQIKI
jgi:hypothetical protein